MFDSILNTLLCPFIYYNEIQISRWLVAFYQKAFEKFPHRKSIYNANLFGNYKLENFESKAVRPSHYLFGKYSWKNVKGTRELFFLIMDY